MRRWHFAERGLRALAALAACALVCLGASAANADTRDEVSTLFADGQLGEAFAATAGIDDAALRAEWRFHLLYTGGDLPGALGAARAGLEHAPDHAGLLANAVRCATLLGLGDEALSLAEHLAQLAGPPEETAEQRANRLEQVQGLVEQARAVAELEAEGAAGQRRALAVALGGLLLSLAALVALARPQG